MGTDHFLGEIVVPLREVEEVDGGVREADIRRYTLGRRSAKDKVRPADCPMRMVLLHLFYISHRRLHELTWQKTSKRICLCEKGLFDPQEMFGELRNIAECRQILPVVRR